MKIRPKYLRGLLCLVVACIILASTFIIAMAKEDDTPAYVEGSALIEESETQEPSRACLTQAVIQTSHYV